MKKIVFIGLISISIGAFAESNSYSKSYSQCLDNAGGVTISTLNCIDAEYKKQDLRLNANYKKIMSRLSGSTKQDLLDSQRLWIKHRNATCDIYPKIANGTMFTLLSNECYLSEVKNRAEYLEYLINISE